MPGLGRGLSSSPAGWLGVEDGATGETGGMMNPGGTDIKPGPPWPAPSVVGGGFGALAANTLPILHQDVRDGHKYLSDCKDLNISLSLKMQFS